MCRFCFQFWNRITYRLVSTLLNCSNLISRIRGVFAAYTAFVPLLFQHCWLGVVNGIWLAKNLELFNAIPRVRLAVGHGA